MIVETLFQLRAIPAAMRVSTLGYFTGITVLCALMYLLYRTQTRPITASDVYMQAPQEGSKDQPLQAAFPQSRHTVVHEQSFKPMVIPSTRNATFDYKAAMQKLNEAKVSQDDPRLIKLIRDYYIEPPSELEYNLENPKRLEYSNGQTPFVDSRLNYMVRFIKYFVRYLKFHY